VSERAIFEADYYNFEYKKGLKVCRLIFEVPYERAKLVRDALGDPPLPGAQVRVAIARLQDGAGAPAVPEKPAEPAPVEKAKAKRSSRAYLMCRDHAFQVWFSQRRPNDWSDAIDCCHGADEVCDQALKWALNITSKTELDTDPEAAARFDALRTDFELREFAR
jgi:hypothetical protein